MERLVKIITERLSSLQEAWSIAVTRRTVGGYHYLPPKTVRQDYGEV
jgi:hypothetical protein